MNPPPPAPIYEAKTLRRLAAALGVEAEDIASAAAEPRRYRVQLASVPGRRFFIPILRGRPAKAEPILDLVEEVKIAQAEHRRELRVSTREGWRLGDEGRPFAGAADRRARLGRMGAFERARVRIGQKHVPEEDGWG